MQADGLGFAAALTEAQALGYAEADPAFDVDGVDAAHKLALLAANAFGLPVQPGAVHVEGIRALQHGDVAAAAQWGYAVKLLALARRGPTEDGAAVELRVHPALLPAGHPLAQVHGVSNGLLVHGDATGPLFFSGAGAGAQPTASAVVADLVDLARRPEGMACLPALGPRAATPPRVLPLAQVRTRHFLRLLPGTALCEAQVLRALAREGLAVQRRAWGPAQAPGGAPTLALLTAPAPDGVAARAAERLQQHTGALVRRLRVEE
jgi:homoserine dehydrogenase